MVEVKEEIENRTAEDWLGHVKELIPVAVVMAADVKGFSGKWKSIDAKLKQVPSCLSDLSSHPCFSRNTLCKEQLVAISSTLDESIKLAESCSKEDYGGKLQMQSNLDSLLAKLDLNLRDCSLLVKTGVLGEASLAMAVPRLSTVGSKSNIKELLVRLSIGHMEAKHKALDSLLDVMKDDEKTVLSAIGRTNVSALVQLLSTSSPKNREKAVLVICSLVESGACESLLISEGVLPPLIRLVESGSPIAKEKATIIVQRLSMAADTARMIVGHGGIPPLIEICQLGVSVSQAAATGTLRNLSAVPEVRKNLAEEGLIKVMINLLDTGILLGTKEYAAECLQNMTCSNESLRKSVISEGGVQHLLAYLDGPVPQESAVSAVRNLVGSMPIEDLMSLGFLPRLVHCLKAGSLGAQQAAASSICRICTSMEMRKLIGEIGCIPLLVTMLEAKTNGAREVASQAIANLLIFLPNCKLIKKENKSVPNLVQLLEPSMQNTAKKYAISCLAALSSSKKCKKLMISYGAIGYLKKLCEMDVPGAKKLLEKLERGKLRSLFSRK